MQTIYIVLKEWKLLLISFLSLLVVCLGTQVIKQEQNYKVLENKQALYVTNTTPKEADNTKP